MLPASFGELRRHMRMGARFVLSDGGILMAYVAQLGTYTPLTDGWAMLLDLNDGQNLEMDDPNGLDMPAPALETFVATNPRMHGARVLHTTYGERTIAAHCMAGPATSYAAMQTTLQTLTKSQEAARVARQAGVLGLGAAPRIALKLQPPGSVTPLYADVLALSHDLPSVGDAEAWVRLLQEGVTVEMVCAPFLRGTRVTLANDVPNPGFEHWGWVNGGGLGSVVFDDPLANLNAYAVVTGAAPTQQALPLTYEEQVLAYGPQAYYYLNDTTTTVLDYSGNGYNGTLSAAGVTESQTGLLAGDANTCMAFNGSSGYVTMAAGLNTNYWAGMSVAVWVKTGATITTNQRITANSHTDLDVHGFQMTLGFFSVGEGTYQQGANTTQAWVANTVYHLVGTYDGANVRYYVNGVLQGTTAMTGTIAPSGHPFAIGYNPAYSGDYFLGEVQSAAYFNAALTQTQITQLYTLGHTGPGTQYVANTMQINAGTTVQFGSPIWSHIANYQARLLYATGVSASFILHYQDANDQVYAIINGTGLVLYQLVGGVTHTLLSLACALTNGVNYWFTATLYPSVGNYPPTYQCSVYNDTGGVRGTTAIATGQAVLNSAMAGISGAMRISAIAGNLVLAGNGYSHVHMVSLFGPGGWRCLNVGSTTTAFPSGAWDSVNTYAGGPVGSARSARMDLPPAGTIYADWGHYFGGDGSNFAVNEVSGQTYHASVWVKSSGLSNTAQVILVASEFTAGGGAILATTSSLTGNVGTWTQLSVTWVANGAGTLVGISCRVNEPTAGASAGATIWFDNVQCWPDALGATMPYCELRHNASPALLMVSGLQGDVPAPALVAVGTQPPSGNLATGASVSLFAGRRSQSTWLPSLVGPSFASAPDGSTSFYVLDPLAYAGYHTAYRGASYYAALSLSGTIANQAGVFHQMLRSRTQETMPGNALLQVDCYELLSAWLGLASYQDRLSVYQTPQVNPWSSVNIWGMVDGGQVAVPLAPLSPSTDPTQIYATTLAQSTNSVVGMDVDWVGMVPTDTEVVAAQLVNSSSTAALNGWLWLYFDGQARDVTGMSSATWSLEPYAAPNVAHAGGAPGTAAGPAPGLNLAGDAAISLDPQLSTTNNGVTTMGVNQFVFALSDSNGDVVPVAVRVTYTPRYLYVR